MQYISIDIWSTILSYLSYLKDIDNESVNPDQLIAIMKMSFVNKSLRDLITSNHFWILYNSIEYESAKYNIYEWNINFCRILRKLKTLKNIENMWDIKIWNSDIKNLQKDSSNYMSIILFWNYVWKNFTIYNEPSIVDNIKRIGTPIFNNIYVCIENEYCTLFKILFDTGKSCTFYIKKQSFESHNYKLEDFVDFCDSYNPNDLLKNIDQFKYFENRTDIINWLYRDVMLHDNYLWFTEISMHNDINYTIKFYAYNVMTSIKYLINEIEISDETIIKHLRCYFSKQYASV